MRYIVTLLFILISSLSFSQDKQLYQNGKMHLLFTDNSGNILNDKPFATNVSVEYNTFFKSYTVVCLTEQGISTLNLSYISPMPDYRARYKDLNDPKETVYIIEDKITSAGTLILLREKTSDYDGKPFLTSFVIADLK
ncbi:MAG: hypothetical protein JWO09_963 [Bacteroidetes bacterium]|nr:hypothetical protein [Bacteroidota bacterium]